MYTFENLEFYRGLSKEHDLTKPTILCTRKDRMPRDLPEHIHAAADQWFLDEFGVKYRSQSLFVTSGLNVAAAYAYSSSHIARILPLGDYSFCWSTHVRDMMELFIGNSSMNSVRDELASANYIQSDLCSAHGSGHEVMLFCEKYICIPLGLI